MAYRIVVIVIGLLALGGGFLASAEARWDDQPADTSTTTTSSATTPLSTGPAASDPPTTEPPTTEPKEEGKDRGNGDIGRDLGSGDDDDD